MIDDDQLGSQFEAMDQLARREEGRIDPQSVRPPVIRTFQDVQRVVGQFAPDKHHAPDTVPISTRMVGELEGAGRKTFAVNAVTHSQSRRDILLEGLKALDHYRQLQRASAEATPVLINGVAMAPPAPADKDPVLAIDPLVRRWFGGERREFCVCWDLDDGYTYKYDIRQHRLTRIHR